MFLKRKDIFVLKDELVRNWGDGSVGKVYASQAGGPEFRSSESVWKQTAKGICNPSAGDQSIAGACC